MGAEAEGSGEKRNAQNEETSRATKRHGAMNRRQFSKVVGAAAGVGAVAGCLSSGGEETTEGSGDGDSDGGTTGTPTSGDDNSDEPKTWNEIEANIEDELIINSWGGSLGDVIQDVWIDPFAEEYDVDVTVVQGKEANVANIIQAVNTGNSPGMDVSFQQTPQYRTLVDEDVLQPLPEEQIPVKSELFDVCQKEYGLGAVFYTLGLAYNTELVDEPPTSWNDLWAERFAGDIATTVSQPEWNLEISNLAAGRDMYPWDEETWNKLWDLRPKIASLAFRGAETNSMFREEKIKMSVWFNGRTYKLADNDFPVTFTIPEEGGIPRFANFVVYDSVEHPNAAKAYINFLLQEEQQRKFAEEMYYASTNKNVEYSEELAEKCIPNSPDQMEQMRMEDWDYITENKPDVLSQFEQWQEGERN